MVTVGYNRHLRAWVLIRDGRIVLGCDRKPRRFKREEDALKAAAKAGKLGRTWRAWA